MVATPGIAAICRLSALPLKDETLVVEVGHRSLLGIAGQKNLVSQAAGKPATPAGPALPAVC